jgi:hypothetical protein
MQYIGTRSVPNVPETQVIEKVTNSVRRGESLMLKVEHTHPEALPKPHLPPRFVLYSYTDSVQISNNSS